MYGLSGQLVPSADLTNSESNFNLLNKAVLAAENSDIETSVQAEIDQFILSEGITNPVDLSLLKFQEDDAWGTEYASSFNKLSSWYFDSGKSLEGGKLSDFVFIDGYVVLVNYLAKVIPSQNILLNSIVNTITHNSATSIVTVGTTSGNTYQAKRVLVTVSLGVLKAGSITFSPPLSNAKNAAIKGLGMGVLDKIYMEWSTSTTFPFGTDGNIFDLLYFTDSPYVEWLNLNVQIPGKYAIIAFTYGDNAIAMESKTDAQIKSEIMSLINLAYPGASSPNKFKVTRWYSNPFAKGSYSNYPPGSTPAMRSTLQSKVDNYLYFSGEATDKDYLATTMGALNSGLLAANNILADINQAGNTDTINIGNDASRGRENKGLLLIVFISSLFCYFIL